MGFRLIKILICAIGLVGSFSLTANIHSSTFKHYSTQDGLSHSGVMCMHQDRDGFMWFGTWDGLNKFDGYEFTTYKSKPGDTNSLSHNRIDYIKEDKFGYLWLITYDGKAHRFDKSTEAFVNFPDASDNNSADYHITDIVEIPNGDIWLITEQNGCFRIEYENEGQNPKTTHYSINSDGDNQISGNSIYFIHQDSSENIWIATNKGTDVLFKQGDNKKLSTLKGKAFTAVFEDRFLWFASTDGFIYRIDLSNNEINKIEIPVTDFINVMNIDQQGNVLLGTRGNGLVVLNAASGKYNQYTSQKHTQLANNNILSVYVDKFGLVWLETDSSGVVKFDPLKKTIKRFQQITEKVSPYVYYGDYFNIFESVYDVLWINLKKGGFCYYNRENDNIEYFYNQPGAENRHFSNLVTCVLSDNSGNLWISTHSRGIEKVSFIDKKFRHYNPVSEPKALSANHVRSMFEDSYGYLWVGTKEGVLYCYKNNQLVKTFSANTTKNGQISFQGMVYCIAQSGDGALWFGTKGDGIVRAEYKGNPKNMEFNTQHFSVVSAGGVELSNNWVYDIYEDANGLIWVATYGGGINIIEKKSGGFKIYNHLNSDINFPINECSQVRQILADNNGEIWAGTTNGLVILETKKGATLPHSYTLIQNESGNINGLANNDVHYLLNDKNGTMWVSTFGGGIGKVTFDGDNLSDIRFKNFTTNDGLPIDIVLAMLEDNDGNFWLSTENGLSKFNPETEIFINYSELDGLESLIFSEASCCISNDGELHFGSMKGFYSFYPGEVQSVLENQKVALVNLQLFNKNVKVNDSQGILKKTISHVPKITLNYQQSVFSIEYAGLYFKNPQKLEYAFILEGFENNWNLVRNQRKATYTDLPAGEYVFKVQSSLTGKFDASKVTTLQIEILPPPWRTSWAYIIYFFVFALLVWLTRSIVLQIIGLKHKVILEQQLTDLKLKFFTNISHELRTPLSLIIGPIEDLLKTDDLKDKTREYLSIIDKNARRMLSHVNNLLDFRKIQTGKMRLAISEIEMVSFLRDIYEGFSKLAQIRNISFTYHANIEKYNAWIDPDKMDTVVFNLLSNAFKFSQDGQGISFEFTVQDEKGYQITIKDQGSGISEEELPFIFERFKTSGQHDEHSKKGTGIGLSLVKEIVHLHKGQVNVISEPGKGSSFIVGMQNSIAQYKKEEVDFGQVQQNQYIHSHLADIGVLTSTETEQPSNKANDAPSILIIEDNKDLRNYISKDLAQTYNVSEAEDGKKGLGKALEELPDLIISDIMMPNMNGIELVDRLRHEVNTSHVPIILLTAKNSLESELEGLKYGADAYISKPFKMEFLKARISNLLQQRNRIYKNTPADGMKVMDLTPDQVVVTNRDEEFLKNVIAIIDENMSNNTFSIEQISMSIGMGRTTFFKKLKSLTGMAPVEFLRDIKLKRGHQLLETGEFTISEIAFKLGFSDAGYFTKCFKEKYRCTPTSVLKKVKETKK